MLKPITLLIALSLSVPAFSQGGAPATDAPAETAAPAGKGAALEAQAAALSAAGKTAEAGDAYMKAGDAYFAEGNNAAAATDYGKAADLYGKQGDAILAKQNQSNAAKPAPPVQPAQPAAPAPPTQPKEAKLPPMAPKAGVIVGRAINEMGGAVTSFTVQYSGFEDGKLANTNAGGQLTETVSGEVKGAGGTYSIKVPQGAYRVAAYATYDYHGRTYNFELEPLNPPVHHDYDNLGLDKLRGGLVRDFVLKMTTKKAGASEETQSGYEHAYYGGSVSFDARSGSLTLGGGHHPPPPLRDAYDKESRLIVTLTPQGPMVDGSTGQIVTANLRLGDDGKWFFSQRGIYPGVYAATASLKTPAGETIPLRLSLTPPKFVPHGGLEGYDAMLMDWKPSVTVDFLPNDLDPFGVKGLSLFVGK